MKARFLVIYGSIILVNATSFLLLSLGNEGRLSLPFVHENLYPIFQRMNAPFTDLKYHVRGKREIVKGEHKIVVVEIDESSLDKLGRWPWSRELMAYLLDSIMRFKPKAVGFDVLFPEPSNQLPEELERWFLERGFEKELSQIDLDAKFVEVVRRYRDNFILEWHSEYFCRPSLTTDSLCKSGIALPNEEVDLGQRFALATEPAVLPSLLQTPLVSTGSPIVSFPALQQVARHIGFADSVRDADGSVRRSSAITAFRGYLFPSFALRIAEVARDDQAVAEVTPTGGISRLRWKKTGEVIPVSYSGMLDINYASAEAPFTTISAADILRAREIQERTRSLASVENNSLTESLNGAVVLLGATAMALGDIHPTPFSKASPGIEIQATLVENLLGAQLVKNSFALNIVVFFAMLIAGAGYVYRSRLLEGKPALLCFLAVFVFLSVADFFVFAKYRANVPSSFLYFQLVMLTFAVFTEKYLREESDRKFLRAAFGKYVSPAVVESLIKDPKSLALGGRKEMLTLLFLDIRGFTTFSETVDAKTLSQFLNEFHTAMTEIVFEYGGTLDKYIGDAIMAFWGAPVSLPDHARRGLEAAVKMARLVREQSDAFKSRYGIDVRVGIGLNSGAVSVGNMGSRRSFNYTAIGDSVNLTSRLEGATKFFGVEILCTEFALQEAKAKGAMLFYRPLGRLRVKGKHEGVEVVELRGEDRSADDAPFLKALSLFQNRQFDEAKIIFTGLPDKASKEYSHACDEYLAKAPPGDWDGSLELHEK